MLIEPWGWSNKDHILQVLPLHHTHGIINVVGCSLWAGAKVEMMQKFKPEDVWNRFINGGSLNLFMAVPTIYMKLIQAFDLMQANQKFFAKESCKNFRLMVSGSAALPITTMQRWEEISGHRLLERYGMSEMGMALSNPLIGERVPGAVGRPLPGVTVRIIKESGEIAKENEEGELRVKGKNVFKGYWKRDDATRETFDEDNWFKTGDIAVCNGGIYRILGRSSVDILKSGGYKISALDIERELLEHPNIAEVAIIGMPDEEFGQIVAAIVSLRDRTAELTIEDLKAWAKARIASYKIPRVLYIFDEIPRNALGKVNKKHLLAVVAKRNK